MYANGSPVNRAISDDAVRFSRLEAVRSEPSSGVITKGSSDSSPEPDASSIPEPWDTLKPNITDRLPGKIEGGEVMQRYEPKSSLSTGSIVRIEVLPSMVTLEFMGRSTVLLLVSSRIHSITGRGNPTAVHWSCTMSSADVHSELGCSTNVGANTTRITSDTLTTSIDIKLVFDMFALQ